MHSATENSNAAFSIELKIATREFMLSTEGHVGCVLSLRTARRVTIAISARIATMMLRTSGSQIHFAGSRVHVQ